MSIFGGSGSQAERSGGSGSESDVSESGDDSSAGASGQHLVTFADAHGFDIELEPGASSKPYASAAPQAAASAAEAQHKQLPARDRQHEYAGADGRWQHKLSKRAPKPGASLAQPVSIFSGRVQSASAEAEDDSAHVKFADPSHQHVSRSSGSRSTSAAAAATSRQQADAAGAAGTVAEQHHWDHKLSKRPPTPGVSLGKPVSIFSASGASSQGEAAGRRGSTDSAASEGTCSEEEVGHVHFAAPRANSSSAAGSRIPRAPADRSSSSDDDDAAPALTSHGGKSKAGTRRAAAVPQQQHEQQQWHHKLSKRPPTPGVSLGQPVSIFSSSGSSGVAAAAGAVSAAPAAADVDSAGVHIHFADQPVVRSSSNTQHSASAGGRRVSWGNEAEVMAPQHNSLHEQPAAHRPKPQQPHAARTAAGGSASGSRSEGRQARSERRRITWGNDADSSSAPGGSSSDAGQHQERRVTWGEDGVPGGAASCTAADGASSGTVAHTEGRRVTWGDDDDDDDDDDEAAMPAPADGRRPGPGDNSSTKQQQQQQHGKEKPGARPATPGWALGQHPESIFLQHANEDASQVPAAAALPAVDAAGAGAAGFVAARARSAGPSLIARLNPDLAAEAAQQKWLQHMADRPPTPGAPLQQQHNVFTETVGPRSPKSAAADSCKLSRIPPAPLAAASSSTDGSSCSIVPGGAGTTKQALLRLSPELAAEAQQQRWQQHMANRSPTPGAGLVNHSNICAEGAAGAPPTAVMEAGSSSSPAAAPARPSASKQALLRLSPELAAEAAQQKWQQHMANRPPTPGASLGHRSIFAGQDDDAGSAVTTHTTPTAVASSNKQAAAHGSSGSSTPSGPAAGQASAQQALLRLSPELAAEAQEQKWQQQMTNRPPTPGASLLQHNIFADDDPTPDPTARTVPAAAAAAAAAAVTDSVQAVRAASRSSSMSRIPSGPVAATAAASAQQALLKLRPELAAEAQEQKWQQHMANRPPTPGASLLHRPNIFAEADTDGTPPAGAAAAGVGGASRSSSMTQGTPGLHGTLLLHNPDLVIEKQQQWEQKLSRWPPTPAATLGKNHNMFADDEQDQPQPPVLRLPSGSTSTSSSGGGVSVAVGSAAVVALPASVAANRSRSPDQARTASSSSGGGSSPGRGASPTNDSRVSDGSDSSSSSRRSSRSGSSNPGRQRGSSPLRNTTTAAEVAEQQDRATHSPLRHSSSMCDPDPARMSPLGRRTSATGASPSSSTPSTPTVTKTAAPAAAVPVSTPAVTAVAAAVAPEAVVGGQAQEAKAARPSQLGGVQSEPHSPSRLARSASPSVLARESGRPSVAQRSSSPLSRSSSSTGQGAEPVRHGSPLSRCSSGGYN